MASIFCPDCGAKAAYTLNKPKFCQGCGVRFGDSVAIASTDQEEEIEVNSWTLGKFDYHVEIDNNTVTFGDLIDNPLDPSQLEERYPLSIRRDTQRKQKKQLLSKSTSRMCIFKTTAINN